MSDASLPSIRDQASAWLARADRGLNAIEQQEFDAWCAADVRHAEAVDQLRSAWDLFDQPREEGLDDILREDLTQLKRSQTRRRILYAVSTIAAACLALVAWQRSVVSARPASVVQTAVVSQPARRVLDDGSIIVLRPGAEVAVNYSASVRWVKLTKGEALFQVAKNKERPFIVSAGGIDVRAVGTAFTVERGQSRVEILVTEGKVSVEKPTGDLATPDAAESIATLEANQCVIVEAADSTAAPVVALDASSVSEKLSWQLPRLDFTETTIAEAVRLFNQHNAVQMRVADDEVAQLRITGVFRSDNLQGFVDLLESSFGVRTTRSDRTITLRKQR